MDSESTRASVSAPVGEVETEQGFKLSDHYDTAICATVEAAMKRLFLAAEVRSGAMNLYNTATRQGFEIWLADALCVSIAEAGTECDSLRAVVVKALREGRHGPMCDRARCVCWKSEARAALTKVGEQAETKVEG